MKEKRTIILVVVLAALIGVYVWHSQRIKSPRTSTVQSTPMTEIDPNTMLMRKVVAAINKHKKENGYIPKSLEQLKGKYLDEETYAQVKKSNLKYAYVNPQAYRLTRPAAASTPVVVAAKKPPAGATPSVAASTKSAPGKLTAKETGWKYDPVDKPDPFKPFILASRPQEEVTPKITRQLTPLQKMAMSEIQAGLKAIIWGQLGSKALVEDATGKGYVVQEGTYVGQHNGIVKRIFEDRIVVEEYKRDPIVNRLVPSEVVLKLKKGEGED